jgi:Holliday junction resolvase RusA-like endonuclease
MEELTFRVEAVPVAQPRQRHRVLSVGGKSFAQNYTPKNDPVNSFKASCRIAAVEAFGERGPIGEPIIMHLVFVMPRPKSLPKRLAGRLPHAKKPDRDNLAKGVHDALEGILYHNDSQVYAGAVEKWVASENETPHVWVRMVWEEKSFNGKN